ncbi:MAG TPA: shikimate kinase [Thermoleophilaceae bacterium]|jgi:shikimate kinase|nr:shikimate kinase [Thermoleophilaceae bacterium]
MGSGKSTVGRLVARSLGWDLVDLDREIARRAGRAIPEIFERCGEGHFRDLEHRALLAALDGERARVVACGGGIVERPENRERLAGVATVFLREDTGVLFGRTRGARRPLRGAGREEFERRYEGRLSLYREVADLEVAVDGRRPRAVAREIERWVSGA